MNEPSVGPAGVDEEAAATTGGDRASSAALHRVLRDTALVVLLGLALAMAGIVGALVALPQSPNLRSPWRLGMRETAWELKVSDPADPRVLAAQRRAALADPRAGMRVERIDESVWLSGTFEKTASPDLPTDVLQDLWTGNVRISPALSAAIARAARTPSVRDRVLGPLLPWLLVSSGLTFLAAGWWCRRRDAAAEVPAARCSRGGAVLRGLATGAVTVTLLMGIDWLLIKGGWQQQEQGMLLAMAKEGGFAVAVFVFATTILAPLAEELFFRGHVFRTLLEHSDRRTAYMVSAVLFTAAHGNPSALPSYMTMALILAWSYERWRTLWVPVTVHVAINATAVGMLLAR